MLKTEQDFFGIYQDVLRSYVQYKRALGFAVGWRSVYSLLELNRFLESCQVSTICLTRKMAEDYIQQNPSGSKCAHTRECIIRQFGLYLRNQGYPNIYIYPEKHTRITSDFVPYIFSKDEIDRIISVADKLKPTGQNPHYPVFYQTLLRVLYCTGLRINEALTLKIEDVDFENGLFIILNAKGNTSRLVPFDSALKSRLKKYHFEVFKDQDTYFFESPRKGKRSSISICNYFQRVVLPTAGIKRKPDNTGPRIHDLRHTFACHCLDKMVRSGMDPFCALPYLSTYLGHKGIESTEKYLRLTEDHFKDIITAGHYIYAESVGDIHD